MPPQAVASADMSSTWFGTGRFACRWRPGKKNRTPKYLGPVS